MPPAVLHPRQQTDFLGHPGVEESILQSIRSGRLPHAWLITGPEGIGKATLAFRLARYLLAGAPSGYGLNVPESNHAARLIAAGAHPDLLVLERPYDEKKGRYFKNIPIEDVRGIAPFLHLTSSQGGWRVIIIDGADALNRFGGQQTLLKILEEPPEQSILILTAENPGMLLPTVHSRCRVLKLNALASDDLNRIAGETGILKGHEDAAAQLLTLAGGSASRLQRYSRNEAHLLFRSWCDFLKEPGNALLRLRLAEAWSSKLEDGITDTALEVIFNWLHSLVQAKARGEAPRAALAPEEPFIKSLYPALQLEGLLVLWESLQAQARQAEAANLDPKMMLLGMLDTTANALAA